MYPSSEPQTFQSWTHGENFNRQTTAFSRVKIDILLRDADWNLTAGSSVLFEHTLPDYVLCDRQDRPMAGLEAKRASLNPVEARAKGCHYAEGIISRETWG